MANLDIESVPFFNRPQSSGPKDRFIGKDEAGNSVFETVTGEVYTIKPAADQRTTRTKIEEDVVPAVKEYIRDPSLPSTEDMKQFGIDTVTDAYESVSNAVRGKGTYGDAMGLAVGSGVASQFGDTPSDALRMFIGRSAKTDLDRLPSSTGKDGKPRWEISDAAFEGVYLEPYNTSFLKDRKSIEASVSNDITDYGKFQGSTLGDVLKHQELYDAYPDLEDIPVVVDESMSDSLLGYVPGDGGFTFVAVNKKLLSKPEEFKNTLLHEVQHLVQAKEGFSRGTSLTSYPVLKKQPEIKKNLDAEAKSKYKKELEAFKDEQAKYLKDSKPADAALRLVDALEEAKEKNLGNKFSLDWNIKTLLEEEEKARRFLNSGDITEVRTNFGYIRTPLDSLENKIKFAISDFSDSPEKLQSLIKEAIGVSPKEFKVYGQAAWSSTERGPDPLLEAGVIRKPPRKKPLKSSGSVSTLRSSDETYRRAAGETEARNTGSGRRELTLEERRQKSPESTEDRSRKDQWLLEDYDLNFSKGGAVEKQMKSLYQEGGLADDGTQVEPVTGNEVPPGSMAEEVRDNVDAKLSEGEYVLPADVVRFIGLGQIERMVAKAKKGLEEMDANGRIGGEPVDSEGVPMEDDELTPEEMQMLAEALGQAPTGMAMGGMVQQPIYNPYQQQQMQYTNPNPTMGMQEGGDVPASTFNAAQYQFGPSTPGGFSGLGGIEIVEYINTQTGETRLVSVMNGQIMGEIPEGFVRSTPETKEQARKNAASTTDAVPQDSLEDLSYMDDSESEQRRGEVGDQDTSSWGERNFDALVEDPISYGLGQLEGSKLRDFGEDFAGRAGLAIAGPAGAAVGVGVGAVSELDRLASARASMKIAEEQGLDITDMQKAIDDYVKDMSGAAKAGDKLGFADGDNRYKSWKEQQGTSTAGTGTPTGTGTSKTGVSTSTGTGGAGEEEAARNAAERAKKLSGGEDVTISTDSSGVTRATSGGASVTVGSSAPKTTSTRAAAPPDRSSATNATDARGRTSEDEDFGREGFNKGAFVTKPSGYKSKVTKKKEKSRRGLGSK